MKSFRSLELVQKARSFVRMTPVLLLVASGSAVAAQSSGPSELKAVKRLDAGQWEFRESGTTGGAVRKLCLPDTRKLIRIQHPTGRCSYLVLANEADQATVEYSCSGSGNGRTTITVETPRRIEVATQGLADGLPFHTEFDGRRVGVCHAGERR